MQVEKILDIKIYKRDTGILLSDVEYEGSASDVMSGVSKGVSRVLTLIAKDKNTKYTKEELLDMLVKDITIRFEINE